MFLRSSLLPVLMNGLKGITYCRITDLDMECLMRLLKPWESLITIRYMDFFNIEFVEL